MLCGRKTMSKNNMRNYISKLQKIGGAHLPYVRNQHAWFEEKEMKTVGVTDYTM